MEITDHIKKLVDLALQEDLGEQGDITTKSTVSEKKTITAHLVSREGGIVAGVDLAEYVFSNFDSSLNIETYIKDGKSVSENEKILTVAGNAQSILQAERTALNFLTHLSGIATQTASYVQAISHTDAQILDTRKTLPGWRALQKHAVKAGGGQNHRMGLYDMVLIKDNHIAAAGGVKNALERVKASDNRIKAKTPEVKVEIEVDTLEQLQEVLDSGGVDIVMLDNMPAEDLKTAVEMAKDTIKTEASGGITLESIVKIAESGVDYISVGALTHSIKALDIGLDIEN